MEPDTNMPRIPLFNLGFRPFYLLAGILAAVSIPVWIAQFLGAWPTLGYLSGRSWHAHELVFGVAIAVITGFLFTAARNWTGEPTPTGIFLAALSALWVAGRVLLLTGPGWLAAAVDFAFVPVVAFALWLPLRRTRNRNQFFVPLLLLFAAANLCFHLAHLGLLAMSELDAVRFALYLVVVIVTIMGGRVIPSFTANAIPTARIRSYPLLDRLAIAGGALALMAVSLGALSTLSGILCAIAAALHLLRLWSWDPLSTRHNPILWILHLSYAWIPLALILMSLASFGLAASAILADHAFAAGAIGGMILGMMTRTARGHTGRPLVVGPAEISAYVLVHLAATARVLVPFAWPASYPTMILVSSALWAMAFIVFVVTYTPILARARLDGKPG